jgi:hypothetical protein
METTRLRLVDERPGDIDKVHACALEFPQVALLDPDVGLYLGLKNFSILLKEDDTFIGIGCYYNMIQPIVEIGLRICSPSNWDKGYGTEVVNALVNYVLEQFPEVHTVVAKTPVINERAIKCYSKCGFTLMKRHHMEGVLMTFMSKERARSTDD